VLAVACCVDVVAESDDVHTQNLKYYFQTHGRSPLAPRARP
jgi:hypothetical protein